MHLCEWSHPRAAFAQSVVSGSPALATVTSQLRPWSLSAPFPQMEPACSTSAGEGQDEVSDLFANKDPCFLLKACEIRDAIDVSRCSYHRPESETTLLIHSFSPAC